MKGRGGFAFLQGILGLYCSYFFPLILLGLLSLKVWMWVLIQLRVLVFKLNLTHLANWARDSRVHLEPTLWCVSGLFIPSSQWLPCGHVDSGTVSTYSILWPSLSRRRRPWRVQTKCPDSRCFPSLSASGFCFMLQFRTPAGNILHLGDKRESVGV